MAQLLVKCRQRTTCMSDRHGLLASLAGRFLVLARTLLPVMAGVSSLPNCHPQFSNWLDGLLWVSVATSFDYTLSMILFVKCHEDQVMTLLTILLVALLTAGLLGTLFVMIKKNTVTPDDFSRSRSPYREHI